MLPPRFASGFELRTVEGLPAVEKRADGRTTRPWQQSGGSRTAKTGASNNSDLLLALPKFPVAFAPGGKSSTSQRAGHR